MKRNGSLHRFVTAASMLAVALLSASNLRAAEEAERFVQALRDRGYHDIALDYLESVRDNPRVGKQFKDQITYQQGVTLIDMARRTRDQAVRDKHLEAATQKLNEYTNQNKGSLEGAKANGQLALVLVERGDFLVARADSLTGKEKTDTLAEARDYFQQAKKIFEQNVELYTAQLKDKNRFPAGMPENDPRTKQRDEMRDELLSSKLYVATMAYQSAKTYPEKSKERKEKLQASADLYETISDDYRNWFVGLFARLYQGRSLMELGDFEGAEIAFDDLSYTPPEETPQRNLLAKTYRYWVESFVLQKKYDEAIEKGMSFWQQARGAEDETPDWLELAYHIALAHKAKAEDEATPEGEKREHLQEARRLLKHIERHPSLVQNEAKDLYDELGPSDANSDPRTFAEALDAANDAFQAWQIGSQDPDADPEEVKEAKDNAAKFYTLALQLRNDKTEVEQINQARMFLCYLSYLDERFWDAAVLGEFLARRYPTGGNARQAAKIAMASWFKLYKAPGADPQGFELEKVVDTAEYITQQWPDQQEAKDAYELLINIALDPDPDRFNPQLAMKYLKQIPADSEIRGASELRVGQALWKEYREKLKMPEDQRPSEEELASLKAQAQQTLENGVQRMSESGEVTTTMALAALALAQIYTDTAQYDKAAEMLEHEKHGPLALVESGKANLQGYPEAAYTAALRVYVSMAPPRTTEAEKMMAKLQEQVAKGGDENAQQRLTLIFISMGRQLQEQIENLKAEGNDEAAEQVQSSFVNFLGAIAQQQQGNDWSTRNWIAQTFYNLGAGIDDGGDGQVNVRAKGYYEKAASSYKKIVEEVEAGKIEPPQETSLLGVRIRLAECLRKTGGYEEAVGILANVLEQKETLLSVQISAANTYHDWGSEEPEMYKRAILGGERRGEKNQYVIWGWGKLGKILAGAMRKASEPEVEEKYRNLFHESRYNLTRSRLAYARSQQGEERQKQLALCKKDIQAVAALFPKLGGPTWRSRYDSLTRDIQKELGEEVVGLSAFGVDMTASVN